MDMVEGAYGFQLVEPGRPLRRRDLGALRAGPGQVVIRVAGCGVCHTDLAFAYGEVRPRCSLPLVLGHEIAGFVAAAGPGEERWLGKAVLVPAVIPCDECVACRAGRPTSCRAQYMPGNDGHGGFASHVLIPARGLCAVPEELPADLSLADLAVVTDAVCTPYEAILRSGLCRDDVAVFGGAGGLGGFGVQLAAAFGAAVVAIDVDPERLALAADHGASLVLDAHDHTFRQMKQSVRAFAEREGRQAVGIKVFETSGTAAGQETAFGLVDHGGYLAVVGFTTASVDIKLSRLMALDATARGNWGCPPERYPDALGLVLGGRVKVDRFIQRVPLDDAPDVLQAVHRREFGRRPVFVP